MLPPTIVCSAAPRLPMMLRERTTMPRTMPRLRTMRWPGKSNAVVTNDGSTGISALHGNGGLHRVRDETFVMRRVVQRAQLVWRRGGAAERDLGAKRNPRHGPASLIVSLHVPDCTVGVGIDQETFSRSEREKPQHV